MILLPGWSGNSLSIHPMLQLWAGCAPNHHHTPQHLGGGLNLNHLLLDEAEELDLVELGLDNSRPPGMFAWTHRASLQ
jgi:hypothetical protein